MSKNSPKQASPLREEIEAYFDRAAASGVQPRLRTVTGVCQFNIEDAGTWHASIENGVVSVDKGAARIPPANCVVSTTAEDFVRILNREGHMNLMAAVLQEIVTVTGDLVFAYTVLGSFVITPSGTPAR
ncbi:MAG TPA: SCP2 sterol-binding domain-containing protein [Ktedonobacterales bacterium]|nr:SCP2 sterol-binding domain-containing protein [Ktedonobacterales bacterium]